MRRIVFIVGILVSAACLVWLVARVDWQTVLGMIRRTGPAACVEG